jgi:hypothetical protein
MEGYFWVCDNCGFRYETEVDLLAHQSNADCETQPKPIGQGGPNRGQGRKPSGYIIRNVKMAFKNEDEYREYINSTSTRSRVEYYLDHFPVGYSS